MIEVGRGDDFHRGVHVPQRDAHDARRRAAAGELDRVAVVGGPAGQGGDLHGDVRFAGEPQQVAEQGGVDVRPAEGDRAAADLHVAQFVLLDRGAVGGVGDVDGDSDVRVDPVGAGAGPAEADLLLHGADGEDRRPRVPLRGPAGRLDDDPHANAVVHAGAGQQVVLERPVAQPQRHRVAHLHLPGGLGPVQHADVDPQVLHLRDLLALLRRQQVDRLAGDHAGDAPAGGMHLDGLPDQRLRVPPADRPDPHEPAVVDVLDQQPDLVAVPGEHHAGFALAPPVVAGVDGGGEVAVVVGRDVRPGGRVLPHDLLDALLVPAGAGGGQQPVEERAGVVGHRRRRGSGGGGAWRAAVVPSGRKIGDPPRPEADTFPASV